MLLIVLGTLVDLAQYYTFKVPNEEGTLSTQIVLTCVLLFFFFGPGPGMCNGCYRIYKEHAPYSPSSSAISIPIRVSQTLSMSTHNGYLTTNLTMMI